MAINRKWLLVLFPLAITTLFLHIRPYQDSIILYEGNTQRTDENIFLNISKNLRNWRYLNENEAHSYVLLVMVKKRLKKLSVEGRILYLDETTPKVPASKHFKILIWKYGKTIEKRHIYHFSNTRFDPFEKCSVNNCLITYKNEDAADADIVLIHLHRTEGVHDLPPKEKRKPSQIWAFLTDESPYHTFLKSKNKLKDYNGIFNWSMTYRMDSDIPVPYGRTVAMSKFESFDLEKYFQNWQKDKRKDVLVTIMGSNCGSRNHRWEYVKELKRHIKVDAYGRCGTLKCPGHFESDCPLLENYKFYLSFENSNCDEYLTEKVWWNAYHKNSIPIVMGASKASYTKLLPPNSYINVEDFASPRDLASYLIYLNNTPSEMMKYFEWKQYFTVLNEHGYFKSDSYHYCRVCEALNYNNRAEKIYNDLESFWSLKNCYPSWMQN